MDAGYAQRVDALARANEVRIAGKELKQEMREGRLTIIEAVNDPRAQRMMLYRLLEEQPRWGCAKVSRLARTLLHRGVRIEGRRVEGFTDRELGIVLAAVLEHPASRHLTILA